jgi:aminoglycoside phosphotransferase (APT) family kinase protein
MENTALPMSFEDLAHVVRRNLRLPANADVAITEVTRWANLNYVFNAKVGGDSLYLKVVTEMPKLMKISLPRERIFFEAHAIRRFRALCGTGVAVPEVLFVDREAFALGMSDVGGARRVLLEVIDSNYSLLTAQAAALGTAIGKVHSASRGAEKFRPEAFEHMLQYIIIYKLLAPGAQALFPDQWPAIAAQMSAHRECLVHGDLWGKNILVGEGVTPAIVDFEGASIGDPAFDVATLLAVAAIPALIQPDLMQECIEFSENLIETYRSNVKDNLWAKDAQWVTDVCHRAYLYTGTFLAARGFGPFAYPLPEPARDRLARLARSLSVEPPQGLTAYSDRLAEYAPVAELV